MNFAKTVATGAFLAATLTAGGALAKAHNQGNTEIPGANVGSETVATSHILGTAKGKGDENGNRPDHAGPGVTPAEANAGRPGAEEE